MGNNKAKDAKLKKLFNIVTKIQRETTVLLYKKTQPKIDRDLKKTHAIPNFDKEKEGK